MAKFRNHKYTWSNPFGSIRHNWEFIGPDGALNFHVSVIPDRAFGPSCGLEFHHTKPRENEAPDHVDCPLTGGRCWHDGTSSYASDHVWPRVEHYLREGDHAGIFTYLEVEYFKHFEREKD